MKNMIVDMQFSVNILYKRVAEGEIFNLKIEAMQKDEESEIQRKIKGKKKHRLTRSLVCPVGIPGEQNRERECRGVVVAHPNQTRISFQSSRKTSVLRFQDPDNTQQDFLKEQSAWAHSGKFSRYQQ